MIKKFRELKGGRGGLTLPFVSFELWDVCRQATGVWLKPDRCEVLEGPRTHRGGGGRKEGRREGEEATRELEGEGKQWRTEGWREMDE